MTSIEQRLTRLEDESAIRKLKASYLNACDAKDPERIRACFTSDAVIDFPPLGEFDVEGLIEIFTQMAVSTTIIDSHQGHNAEIDILGDKATAIWNLGFATYNPEDGGFRLLSGLYYDEYEKTKDGWKLSYTRSEPRSIFDGSVKDGSVSANWIKEQP